MRYVPAAVGVISEEANQVSLLSINFMVLYAGIKFEQMFLSGIDKFQSLLKVSAKKGKKYPLDGHKW